MAPELSRLVDPEHTVLVTQECQVGVMGDASPLPSLAAAARDLGPRVGKLAGVARQVGVPVVHCLAWRRADGLGSNTNARLFQAARRFPPLVPGSAEAAVVPEIEVAESDLVFGRYHGLGPLAGTDLDAVLRNLGVRTIVGVGVSVNVGITNFVMDAVNLGYQFVLPRDCVAGVPASYADAVIEGTLSLLATVVTCAEVIAAWEGPQD
jgi:biuret amidohydrolase